MTTDVLNFQTPEPVRPGNLIIVVEFSLETVIKDVLDAACFHPLKGKPLEIQAASTGIFHLAPAYERRFIPSHHYPRFHAIVFGIMINIGGIYLSFAIHWDKQVHRCDLTPRAQQRCLEMVTSSPLGNSIVSRSIAV